MKLFNLIVLLSLLPFTVIWGQEQEDTVGYVVFVDSVPQGASYASIRNNAHSSRQAQNLTTLYSRNRKISAVYDANSENVTYSILHCVRMAMDIWEDKLQLSCPISFYLGFSEDLDPDIEIKTVVYYSGRRNGLSKPSSLYHQVQRGTFQQPDSMLINTDILWDYSLSYNLPSGNDNLLTALLRHIAHILGFGTSIIAQEGIINFTIKHVPSVFDNLIMDSNNCSLASLRNANPAALQSFLCQNLHLSLSSGFNYMLYSDSEFSPYRSGKYFSLVQNNLMNYPYIDGSLLLNVNKETMEALEEIGWAVNPYKGRIYGSNVDVAGYGSAYMRHVFQATAPDGNIATNASWKYQVFSNSSMQYTDVKTGTGNTFVLDSLTIAASDDATDPNNNLEGRIVCTIENVDYTMPLFGELRPHLQNCQLANVNESPSSVYYSFDVILTCLGTTQGSMCVSNEYTPSSTFYFNGSGESVIHVSNVFKYGQTYLDIDLENTYGHTLKRIYLDTDDSGQLTASPTSYEQKSVSLSVEINGQPAEDGFVIKDGDAVSLAVNSGAKVEKVGWLMRMEGKDGCCWEKVLEGDTEKCDITMRPHLFSGERDAHIEDFLRPVTDPATMNVFNEGQICARISVCGGRSYYLAIPVSLNVLPKKPKLSVSNYREIYDSSVDMVIPVVDAEIKADGFETLFLEATAASLPKQVLIVFEKGEQMPYSVKDVDWGSMGCSYICWAVNGYGQIASDSVNCRGTTKVDEIEKVAYSTSIHGNTFTIKSARTIQEIDIFGISAQHLLHEQNVNHAEVRLPSGVYILRIKIQGKEEIRKFIIK